MTPMIYTSYGFAIFFFIFWCAKWLIHILAISYGKYKLHGRKKCTKLLNNSIINNNNNNNNNNVDDDDGNDGDDDDDDDDIDINNNNNSYKVNAVADQVQQLPFVSILKPLMGIDPNLQHNLETFFTMNYRNYELLFCVEDKNDPAINIVNEVMAKYPQIDAQLFCDPIDVVGVNPKINNINQGYKVAKYELIMISDSGIRMKEDTLLDMIEHMTDKIGLVHQMPFTCDRDGFAATIEKIFFGTAHARIYLCADLIGINCHTGMSCIVRKSILDKLGGLKIFGCYLAEDFFMAKAVIEMGWKMCISNQPAWQNSGVCDVRAFQERLKRWAKLRVAMLPTVVLFEPLTQCMVIGALAAWSTSFLFGWDALVFYLIHILIWFLMDWILLTIIQNGTLPFNKFEFVIGWLVTEFSVPYLFFRAVFSPTIHWRQRQFTLAWGGKATELLQIEHLTNISS